MHSEVLYNPELIRDLGPEEIVEVFQQTAGVLSGEDATVYLEATEGQAIFVGDTHGDFTTTKWIIQNFIESPTNYLIFLGDYIDREPEPEGSLYNLLYLCIVKLHFPERVFLLKGNHEANYTVSCYPYEFDGEVVEIFGSFGHRIHREAVNLFREMPLMFKTANGVVASHGGFPLRGQAVDDKSRQDLILDILWADAAVSPVFRGYGIPKFTEDDLNKFLKSVKASCFIRGHDYNLAGKIIYSNRCITVFTCRRYALLAGIKIAKVDLSKQIKDAKDVILEDITFLIDT